ncbi:molybdopterin-synthase adenylyltransferase MoeB [Leekyejoonella antrihumi]|uniref:Molybdopterin-synthase adenylyltransferase MoeB n=1 Tax=Leekyejoonella antrihumi TaxID=1660198 RepID=A0A563DU22_9MICO|nr:molybdopterin-synthase adenylyltransferase MoeB [Leekyejoonella antrihumi]TWP33748.1 molybdopterin-synthase adenylyltransferase MoeB [Leekyejoonella antrihumi]
MSRDPLVPLGAALPLGEVERYSRHLLLPEIGEDGQRRLRAARVLVVGAGGLAAPVLLYLAAAGVGHLTVIDDDVVDVSNLQRQVIHRDVDLGQSKVVSAARAVRELNPDVTVDTVQHRLDADRALLLFADHDLVVDTTDNFATRYLVNDACVVLGLPLVWGSIHRFDGQATVWWAGEGPCYRCVFPYAPPPGTVPSCAEAGVLGSIPGVIGSIQATETVKLILGLGEPLVGRMLVHDAMNQTWDTVRIEADPDCPVCGTHPSITRLEDEAALACETAEQLAPVATISARELRDLIRSGPVRVIDVRTPAERSIVAIEGSELVPVEEFRDGSAVKRLADLDPHAPLVFYCKGGARSQEAARIYQEATGGAVRSLDGGVLAWAREVDPSLARY